MCEERIQGVQCFVVAFASNGQAQSVRTEETRVWHKKDAHWQCVHFHRSGMPTAGASRSSFSTIWSSEERFYRSCCCCCSFIIVWFLFKSMWWLVSSSSPLLLLVSFMSDHFNTCQTHLLLLLLSLDGLLYSSSVSFSISSSTYYPRAYVTLSNLDRLVFLSLSLLWKIILVFIRFGLGGIFVLFAERHKTNLYTYMNVDVNIATTSSVSLFTCNRLINMYSLLLMLLLLFFFILYSLFSFCTFWLMISSLWRSMDRWW